MAAAPTVSVIVPVYNVERFLDQALCSLEAQTLRDIEIICVNDGSTDSSPGILSAHAARDGRVRVVDKPNGGYGSACNRGIDEARGTWVAILEPDDWVEPAMYADMVAFADSLVGAVDIVKTPYLRVVDPDTPRERTVNCSYRGRVTPRAQPFAFGGDDSVHLMIHHPSIWSALYRADFLRGRGIRFREIPGAGWADNPFLVETLCQARGIAYLDRPYYHYREETPAHFAATVRRDPSLLFDRWNDMMDVVERLGVRSRPVRSALVRRGFTYLDSVGSAVDLCRPDLQRRVRHMFSRMDDALVLGEDHVPPRWKAEYARMKGLAAPAPSALPYYRALGAIGLYNLRNVGPAFTMGSLRGFLGGRPAGGEAPVAERDGGEGGGEPPLFSVVVPAYNAERTIDECLASLEAQSWRGFEAVCVDDGSTDSTPSKLDAWAGKDDRFRTLAQPNGGPSRARNAGIAAARGQYIVFLDSDDLLAPGALERLARVLGYGETDAVVFGWSCFGGRPDHWTASRGDVPDEFYPAFDPGLLFDRPTQPFLRIAVRRGLLGENGVAFDEDLYLGEDAAFLFSLVPLARGTRLLSDKLYRYRLPHEGSIMQRIARDPAEECLQGLNTVISVFGEWARRGWLQALGPQLVSWSVKYSLYTVLRQDEPLRAQLAAMMADLWRAHWPDAELRAMQVPPHARVLVERALDADTADPGRDLMAYRLAEYGPLDLARTALDRL